MGFQFTWLSEIKISQKPGALKIAEKLAA